MAATCNSDHRKYGSGCEFSEAAELRGPSIYDIPYVKFSRGSTVNIPCKAGEAGKKPTSLSLLAINNNYATSARLTIHQHSRVYAYRSRNSVRFVRVREPGANTSSYLRLRPSSGGEREGENKKQAILILAVDCRGGGPSDGPTSRMRIIVFLR